MPSQTTVEQFSMPVPYSRVLKVNGDELNVPLGAVSQAFIAENRPIRTFRWFKGQRHYPGTNWSATEAAHVIYESRLELRSDSPPI